MQNLPTREGFESLALHVDTALRGELTGLKQEMTDVTARVSTLEVNATDISHSVSSIQTAQTEVADKVTPLMLLLDDLENCNRRCNIRIKRLPEATLQADLKATVSAIFNTLLEHPPDTCIAIDRVHRTLGPRKDSEDRPRDVLCCIHSYSIKEDILQRAWSRDPIEFDGAQIFLLPDVSQRTLQMHCCMKPLLEKFGKLGTTYKWGHPFHSIARIIAFILCDTLQSFQLNSVLLR